MDIFAKGFVKNTVALVEELYFYFKEIIFDFQDKRGFFSIKIMNTKKKKSMDTKKSLACAYFLITLPLLQQNEVDLLPSFLCPVTVS